MGWTSVCQISHALFLALLTGQLGELEHCILGVPPSTSPDFKTESQKCEAKGDLRNHLIGNFKKKFVCLFVCLFIYFGCVGSSLLREGFL